jgi:hypothetical protein
MTCFKSSNFANLFAMNSVRNRWPTAYGDA